MASTDLETGTGSAPAAAVSTAIDRTFRRLETLVHEREKLERFIETLPNDPRVSKWKMAVAQYNQSITNIQEHGRETVAPRPVGAKIDVPAVTLKVITEMQANREQRAKERAERRKLDAERAAAKAKAAASTTITTQDVGTIKAADLVGKKG